jgi:hypothetical protein
MKTTNAALKVSLVPFRLGRANDDKHKITLPRHEIIQKGTLLTTIQQAKLTRKES